MTIAANVYNAWNNWLRREPGKDAEYVKANPDAWKIVQHIIELRTHG